MEHYGMDGAALHPYVRRDDPRHQGRDVLGLRADVVHALLPDGDRLADVVLAVAVVVILEPRVHDLILEIDQPRLGAHVLL